MAKRQFYRKVSNSITEVDKQISNINVAKNTLLTLGYINEDMISKM